MKRMTLALAVLTLPACSGYFATINSSDKRYFADASACFHASEHKEFLKVPTGTSMSTIGLSLGNDADRFSQCMQYAGHPVTKADPAKYLKVSKICFLQARGSDTPDETYAQCVQHGKLAVETMPADNASKPKP